MDSEKGGVNSVHCPPFTVHRPLSPVHCPLSTRIMTSYPGGKSGAGTFQRIISQIPPHRLYVEPFVGGGGILLRKRPAEQSIVCDLDPAAIERIKALYQETSLQGAVAAANAINGGEDLRGRNGDAISQNSRLTASVRDGLDLLKETRFELDTFIYVDPPYLQTAVLSRLRYQHVLSVDAHRRLLRVLKAQRCPVMLSGYWSRLYAEELAGWRTIQFGSMTRGGYQCEEWLWMNYPQPTALHDYRFVGENYREREKFRRQQRRWSTRLAKMSFLQRQALMSVLVETMKNGVDCGR